MRAAFLSFGLAFFVSACGTSTSSSSTQGDATASAGASMQSICATDPRAEAYAVGLTATATDGALSVKYLDADPAPPSKGLNTWNIEVDDAKGRPVEGATISVKLWMPDHGHGASVVPTVTDMGKGQYQVTLVDLFMPGIWQVTFNVKAPAESSDSAMFTFCVDG